ncbi:MAG: glycosyltransferase [Alphaproteobacteria bacterium]|nr:glycosyltransferase [Alphaproteobacteria bacterium]
MESTTQPLLNRLDGRCVLQVIPALDAGGAERTVVEVAQAVISAGGRALVASEGGRLVEQLRTVGGEHVMIPLASKNPITMLANAKRIGALIAIERVDIVDARSRAPAWSAYIATRRTGAALVTTHHGAYSEGIPGKRLYNSIMTRGDLVIANSAFTATEIARRRPGAADRMRVIPRGADLGLFDPAAVETDRIRRVEQSWGLGERSAPERGKRILLPARLTPWKGQRVAIAAFHEARSKAPDAMAGATLILAGDSQGRDRYVEELTDAIRSFGLVADVLMVGHCDDMPAAYAAVDLAIAPSMRAEAFGRTVVEAGAMGLPVIASDCGGYRESVVDGETGFLVPPGDIGSLSDAIARVCAMLPDERSRLGASGMVNARQNFSIESMARATIAAYWDLASGHPSRDR